MENNVYPRDSGVLYRSTIETVLKVKNKELRGKFATSVLQYLIEGHYDEEGKDDILDSLMTQPMYNMDQSAGRYDAAVENGTQGGGKERFTDEDVYNFRVVEKHSVAESVEHFGYSERTIRDKVAKFRKGLAARATIEQPEVQIKAVEPTKVTVTMPAKVAAAPEIIAEKTANSDENAEIDIMTKFRF